jgi:hypothetical protein
MEELGVEMHAATSAAKTHADATTIHIESV